MKRKMRRSAECAPETRAPFPKAGTGDGTESGRAPGEALPVNRETLRRAMELLRRYKTGKARFEARLIENEQWWKLRHWDYLAEQGTSQLRTRSAWLVNVLLSKHADAVEALPEASFLPREQADEAEAERLRAIVPLVLQQNEFEQVWSENWWKKLKAGVAFYGVFWDPDRLDGLGDIAIRRIDPLQLFWEPGVTELQQSRNLFHVELADNDALEAQYPQLHGKLGGRSFAVSRYLYDDSVDTSDKSPVVDWYYKKRVGSQTVLHFVKFVGDTVLYATENDAALSDRGLYDHGRYPFFADVLFPEEGTPGGFGYIDLCKDAQRQIDLMNSAIVANCVAAATPRWLKRGDDGVNEEEYADWSRPFVHVQGSLEENVLRPITVQPLSGNYLELLGMKINEMKETSGNRDVNNGGISAGVTAASAIAAMQEQSGKLSRDQIAAGYRCFRQICYCVIELIRQFYDVPRQFRIVGADGIAQYVRYDNLGLQPQAQEAVFGLPTGLRRPIFDIEVAPQKQATYSRLSNNEMALQFFRLGFFDPRMAEQALGAIEMMDFKGREALRRRITEAAQRTGTAACGGPGTGGPDLSAAARASAATPTAGTDLLGALRKRNLIAERARAAAAQASQPR